MNGDGDMMAGGTICIMSCFFLIVGLDPGATGVPHPFRERLLETSTKLCKPCYVHVGEKPKSC